MPEPLSSPFRMAMGRLRPTAGQGQGRCTAGGGRGGTGGGGATGRALSRSGACVGVPDLWQSSWSCWGRVRPWGLPVCSAGVSPNSVVTTEGATKQPGSWVKEPQEGRPMPPPSREPLEAIRGGAGRLAVRLSSRVPPVPSPGRGAGVGTGAHRPVSHLQAYQPQPGGAEGCASLLPSQTSLGCPRPVCLRLRAGSC